MFPQKYANIYAITPYNHCIGLTEKMSITDFSFWRLLLQSHETYTHPIVGEIFSGDLLSGESVMMPSNIPDGSPLQ